MFEKVSQAAERLASHASRRVFLGQLGTGALALVGVLGGVLASPGRALAGTHVYCCYYPRGACSETLVCSNVPCPSTYNGLPLGFQTMEESCRKCGVPVSC
jgi:hypothetical protein